MGESSELLAQASASRDMAKRARRLAGIFLDGPDRDRLLPYAKELDERAAGLEAQASQDTAPPTAAAMVTREQQQVQQQAAEPTPDPPEPKAEK
jgi:hypothetical protein